MTGALGGRPRRALLGTRVGGVGVGVIVILFMAIAACGLCYVGSTLRKPAISVAATVGFFVLAAILFVAPRGTADDDSLSSELDGYDDTVSARLFMLLGLLGGVVCAFWGWLLTDAAVPRVAKPLDFHVDVLLKGAR